MTNIIEQIKGLFKRDYKITFEEKHRIINEVFNRYYDREARDHVKFHIDDPKVRYFRCPGAGRIFMKSCLAHNQTTAGFVFGVEWGKYGFGGGHISIKELRKMANWINSEIDAIEASGKSELQTINKFRAELKLEPLKEIE